MHVIGVVLSLGIVSACCQTVLAEVVPPPHPNHSWLFDEGTGDTAASHSDKFEAALQTGATWSNDVHFDYVGNWSIDVTEGEVQTLGFPLGAAGTISMWARCTSHGAHRYLLDSESPRTLLDVNLNDDGEEIYINGHRLDYGQSNWANSGNFSIDQWHHIAITWDNTKLTKVYIYLDGELKTSANNCGAASEPTVWYFGKRYVDGPERWRGQIDEYAFWNTALSSDEVAWLSNNSLAGLPEPCSLLLATIGLIGLLVYGRRKRS